MLVDIGTGARRLHLSPRLRDHAALVADAAPVFEAVALGCDEAEITIE